MRGGEGPEIGWVRSGGWAWGELEQRTEDPYGQNSLYDTLKEVIKKKKCRTRLGSPCMVISTRNHGQWLLKASARGQVASFITDTSGWKLLNLEVGQGLLKGKHSENTSKERRLQSPKENLTQAVPQIHYKGTGNTGARAMF